VRVPRVRDARLLTVAALAGLIGALLAVGMTAAVGGVGTRVVVTERVTERQHEIGLPASAVNTGQDTDVVSIARDVRPTIVHVLAGDGAPAGSGVVFRSDGLVLTNHHVVANAAGMRVVFADGVESAATVVGSDAQSDIAVLQVENDPPEGGYPTALLGTAATLEVGQLAIAVGSPLGLNGGPSVTVGVVSALGREVPTASTRLVDMIQFDAPVAPGSSGGALVDANGAVVGITTAIAVSDVGAEGMGFATPIDIARSVADQLAKDGHVVHVWLGIEGDDIDAVTSARLGILGGAVVRGIRGGSPADVAGLKPADIIVAVDDEPIRTMGSLMLALRAHEPGDVVVLRVHRLGSVREMKAILREMPS
jgi:S1-C subfamily serine protease